MLAGTAVYDIAAHATHLDALHVARMLDVRRGARALGEKGVLFCVFSKVPAVTFYG